MDHPQMHADVVIVGGGPAGLACALHLARLIDLHNGSRPAAACIAKENIVLLEKGRELGAHQLSGAVMDPRGLAEIEPDFAAAASLGTLPVTSERVNFFTARASIPSPLTPPPLRNHGNFVVSVNRLAKWLGEKVEAAGVTVFTGSAGRSLLFNDGSLSPVGVRTDTKGLDRAGRPKANFEPGTDLRAPIVVLAEGPRGSLTGELAARLGLAGANPQLYSLGIKEIWEVPAGRFAAGRVVHTMGWPLSSRMYGGGWIYGLEGNRISIGLVTALEYEDPATDPHQLMQQWKTHPSLRRLLHGGEMLRYGAKTVPMGGWYSIPPAAGPGWLIIGDGAGYLNSRRLKGIHLAIKSGMLAAESVMAALAAGDPTLVGDFTARVEASWIREELWEVRNFHQGFAHGMAPGMLHAALQMVSGGRGLHARYSAEPGPARMRRLADLDVPPPVAIAPDGKLTFDKTTAVFHSGTRHEEDQPPHLLIHDTSICNGQCTAEYGNPCQHFCPANVYEMVFDAGGDKVIHLNPSNCVHCKTCDVMDPYGIITWVPPEGGGGPNYEGM